MSTYSFTITSSEKFAITGSTTYLDTQASEDIEVVADRGLGRQTKFNILRANFGDGYEQRVRNGINNAIDVFTLSFKNRTQDEINLIAGYFDYKRGLSFTFTVTDGINSGVASNTSYKVVCEDYNISFTNTELQTITTKFRRVYEP